MVLWGPHSGWITQEYGSRCMREAGWFCKNICCCSIPESCPTLTPLTVAYQAPLSTSISQSLLKFVSIELVMPSNHLILCHPLLLLPAVFPSLRVYMIDWNKSLWEVQVQLDTSVSVTPHVWSNYCCSDRVLARLKCQSRYSFRQIRKSACLYE